MNQLLFGYICFIFRNLQFPHERCGQKRLEGKLIQVFKFIFSTYELYFFLGQRDLQA